MQSNYGHLIRDAKSISQMFQLVKTIVKEYCDADQAGLLIGLSDLGSHGQGFIGAYYAPDANTIVINKRPLKRIQQTKPELYNFYLFHVLLHEYIHSIGFYDEAQTRQMVYSISQHHFGTKHVLTQFSTNISKFIPDLTYPQQNYQPPEDLSVDYLHGIDRSNTNYIN